ncbi:hypothetical protein DB346_20740 [Verrucomicrobia bacterium LW23]|nr:hypothetical protein DB346_20740 [Verrucomicrobia bacterium LW23]
MSLQLASPFQDNAVLQRDQTLPVWGWTAPNAIVKASIAGNVACCISNAHGEFLLRLPPLAAGGPHSLVVEASESGDRVTLQNILVGEVWLASGQSNMGWTMAASLPVVEDDVKSAEYPEIRFFNVPRTAVLGPQSTVEARWENATPESVLMFSAVAFAFARRLHKALGVPIGVLSSAWGGTFIQAWLSRSALAMHTPVQDWLATYESAAWGESRWDTMIKTGEDGRVSTLPTDPGNTGVEKGWASAAFDDTAWPVMDLPTTWQYAGLEFSGVLWFRRTVTVPAAWAGRELSLRIGTVDKQDITYVNGQEVGRTGKGREEQWWNVERKYVVPAAVLGTGGTLSIAVRAFSFVHDGGLRGPAQSMKVHPVDAPEEAIPLAGGWRYAVEHNLGQVRETHIMGHGEQNSPHILFDNMIRPLIPYALKGAIWYQGESNASQHDLYGGLLRELILDWRRHWGMPRMAFYTVQLPNYMAPMEHQQSSKWARLRESQLWAHEGLADTGLAVTIDVGEEKDIHPKDKMPVGLRLANTALRITYGDATCYPPPAARGFSFGEDGRVTVDFHHAEDGLSTTDGAPLRTFFVAGDDRVFHPALAEVTGSTVVVRSDAVPRPVAVRYAWADNPLGCNLANHQGLPASPFRSDCWEIQPDRGVVTEA